jgi:hypothetical protein
MKGNVMKNKNKELHDATKIMLDSFKIKGHVLFAVAEDGSLCYSCDVNKLNTIEITGFMTLINDKAQDNFSMMSNVNILE